MNDHTLRNDDRGVSELVGFVIVFGIIIGSVGILYMTGFSAMGAVQEQEQTRNAERAMDALAENLNDIVEKEGVAYRSGEMSLREGTLSSTDNETTVAVNVPGEDWINASGTLSYQTGDTEIVYEGGAVVRSTESGDWTIREPPIRCTDDTAIISLVQLDVDETAVNAAGTRAISATHSDTTVHRFEEDEVTIRVDSPRAEAWERSLAAGEWEHRGDDADGIVTCDLDGGDETVIVRTTTMDLDYS
ncbi:hypothetical protein Halru_1292 [Halovivax ruber XH-70]|uniref:Archaeal flagellin-like protein n=1 Tax=Halovivax ruber (strain DSM 18193 / JCM 13892 / XH-70) TaxID=797302 RepID=L0ICG5_HALRX|nr:hypothetical protein [Halovivax ruber]AGB15906.1 hypothetical protein Halru_1292 [Halovivax ruber XH-70]